MSYGHAERTVATIRLFEAETTAFLNSRDHLDQGSRNGCVTRPSSLPGVSRPLARCLPSPRWITGWAAARGHRL